ncbi:uncharacterized protein MONBRDRAFT_20905 [Monosiga brevicollis MX1]|uniref:Obg-like ATPase 1 n=1 Tax=Monosiga brevicollis TaxID=81824 RepID=A9UXF4_MONBE|nr:uncharacterized protein MONBRDRAFT_20905 [Monosiga brevicollis MX1]EDQ89996.1 predicted protein [Monosiga brevicollis MX1]|eukprot:XP_001745418.1 hypothetical protein [Monosiga brevicollis MX1]
MLFGATWGRQFVPSLRAAWAGTARLSTSRRVGALKTGLVGLPNVGKSSLFNALLGTTQAEAANYPFCTIEPNVGTVLLPDERLDRLAHQQQAQRTVYTTLQYVDIAGLVRDASQGAGLGNQFLANIRECDLVVHVVRVFPDENVTHVEERIDPLADIDIIELELQLADLGQIERLRAKHKNLRLKEPVMHAAAEKLHHGLNSGLPASACELTEEEVAAVRSLGLITLKPMIYAINTEEDQLAEPTGATAELVSALAERGQHGVLVSAKFESELAILPPEDRLLFLEDLGLTPSQTGLGKLVRASYQRLDLLSFFTAGVTEARAWSLQRGAMAPQAAGVIHSDFEKHFIKAEVIAWDQLLEAGGFSQARERGWIRLEGREYAVQDGDVIVFKTAA